MFGSKFKTWMENHIGRPKRKAQHDKEKVGQTGGKGPILESSESLAHSDTGISSGSQQVLSSSNTDNNEGYCTTTMESNRSGLAHCHTAVNLSSPESAYSTGYSTDGTSPGGTGPPEYYINIRTGKHYFPSPAPTPTSPQPSTAFSQYPSVNHCITTSFLASENAPSSIPSYPSELSSLLSSYAVIDEPSPVLRAPSGCLPASNGFIPPLAPFVPDQNARRHDLSSSVPNHFNFSKSPAGKTPPKSPLSTFKIFLKSPKQDKVKQKSNESKTPTFQNKKKAVSPMKNKKWYKQPFQKFGHRRTDSTDGTVLKSEIIKKEIPFDRSLFFITKDNTSSPRQRNRIRTNPWLPTEPLSSQNFHSIQLNFPPNLTRNRSCTNTPLQNRKTSEVDTVQNMLKEIAIKNDDSRDYRCGQEKSVHRQKILLEPSDHSEEDLTLNEMMGTYNESYVYEKETDILSDSDPTDCEDYVSDSEADNGGDEQDSHDDELDFIDNGSIVEGENFLGNTGKCSYYDIYSKKNHFLSKSCRHHSRNEGESRKSCRNDGADPKRRKSKDEKKKKSFRKSARNPEQKIAERQSAEPVKVINMSKLLMQRANVKKGSKSADGTPVCLRRRKLIKELRETHIGDQETAPKTAVSDDSPSVINAVLEDDLEADKKYKELMLEAENIFVTMQNSPVIQARKSVTDVNKEKESSLSVWREAETLSAPKLPDTAKKPDATPRRNLGLSLAVDSKKPNFGSKNSFKAKSSAHSPLDPLGPTFKNFTVFKEVNKKISSSSSDDSESNRPAEVPERGTQNVVPIAFQSVDLGKPLTSYCPQSEPVKRKIYSCSKTYDQLLKRFENETKMMDSKGMRQSSKRCESYRSVPHEEGMPRSYSGPRRKEKSAVVQENGPGKLFYNPVYSPYSSPAANRKLCNRSNVPSPGVRRRLSYDVDAIR